MFELKENTDYMAVEKKYVFGTWRFQHSWNPLIIEEADGYYFKDINGIRYLDFSSQLMCSNLGHKNPKVISTLSKQANKLCYIAPSFATIPAAKLGEKLAAITLGDLGV